MIKNRLGVYYKVAIFLSICFYFYFNYFERKKINPLLVKINERINFDQLRSYRLNRVKKELEKRDIGACILFDPVNIRYALDSVNMSIFNMHNLDRYCFIPLNGPVILFEYFNCEHLSKHLKLINEIRPGISWDYFSHGDQAEKQINKWTQ